MSTHCVLGIETSCDETGVALYDPVRGLVADRLFSQVAIHRRFGGVVPELASRDHVRQLLPLIESVMQGAKLTPDNILGIAYTSGPGLVGALMVGATVARSLGWAWGVPTVGVHHLESHVMAVMLEDTQPAMPFLALLVSGGHTQLIVVRSFGQYELLGDTLDDAVGEAFDKVAKLLGLTYPGGPAVERLALTGDASRFAFPRPMVNRPGMDFSFSGLKTFTMRCIGQYGTDADEQVRADIARGFEESVVDVLAIKASRALRETGLSRLAVVGGVSANKRLRHRFNLLGKSEGVTVYFPRQAFCTDNGAMVAYNGYLHLRAGRSDNLSIKVYSRLPLASDEDDE